MQKIEVSLRKLDKFHYTVQLLKISINISLLAFVFFIFYYMYYINSGNQYFFNNFRLTTLLVFYELLYNISTIFLFLLLILIAKGWTIIYRKLSHQGRLKVTIYTTVYFWSSILCIIWRNLSYEPCEKGNLFRSTPGILLIVIKGLLIIWLLYALYITFKKTTKKVHFYYKFSALTVCYLIVDFCINYVI